MVRYFAKGMILFPVLSSVANRFELFFKYFESSSSEDLEERQHKAFSVVL